MNISGGGVRPWDLDRECRLMMAVCEGLDGRMFWLDMGYSFLYIVRRRNCVSTMRALRPIL